MLFIRNYGASLPKIIQKGGQNLLKEHINYIREKFPLESITLSFYGDQSLEFIDDPLIKNKILAAKHIYLKFGFKKVEDVYIAEVKDAYNHIINLE